MEFSKLLWAAAQLASRAEPAESAVEAPPGLERIRLNIARHRYGPAIAECAELVDRSPSDEELNLILVSLLHKSGQSRAAEEQAARALRHNPNSLALMQQAWMGLPMVYTSESEVRTCRERFRRGLARLEQAAASGTAADGSPQALQPNFLLPYQGRNDRELQSRFGALIHALQACSFPAFAQRPPMPALPPGGRIRVGYLSSYLRHHTVGKLFLGWVEEADRSRFEIYVYHLGPEQDLVSNRYRQAADRYRHLTGAFESICAAVREDELHILVHLDQGMSHLSLWLGALYLAPIQCLGYGQASTSGLPSIDYFLSADSMETDQAPEHYSEKLVRLPGSGLLISPPYIESPPRQRSELGLADSETVYLSPQSLYKYLPTHDGIFPAIAQRVESARFVFISHPSRRVTAAFSERLNRAFGNAGLDADDHVTILRRLRYDEFIALNCQADIFLDQPGWSGCMTALEALGCGLPVLTWPGTLMRSRHCAGFLRILGQSEWSAATRQEFIDHAVRLGRDAALRQSLSEHIVRRHDRLFRDHTGLLALEDFYASVVDKMARSTR